MQPEPYYPTDGPIAELCSRIAEKRLADRPDKLAEYREHGGRIEPFDGGLYLFVGDELIATVPDSAIRLGVTIQGTRHAN